MKYLIFGLGNIGDEYVNTRHNIGFNVLDNIANSSNAVFKLERHAYVTKVRFKNKIFVLVKPTTYMNLSGKAVRYWMNKENLTTDKILVIADDIDLPIGRLRLRAKGSGGSHNGINNIIELIQTSDFPRLRIGIGNDFKKGQKIDFVLGKWAEDEKIILNEVILNAAEVVKSFATTGISRTMNVFNTKPNKNKE